MLRRIVPVAALIAVAAPHGPALAAEAAVHTPPARIESLPGSSVKKVTLTERAARRLDIQTSDLARNGNGVPTVPYAAIVYDKAGRTWVYTNPEPLVFIRHPVAVANIVGNEAQLSEMPAANGRVVIVGVPQLYGAEIGIGK